MAFTVVIALTLISLTCARTPSKNLVAQRQVGNGEMIYYVKGGGDKTGMASTARYIPAGQSVLEVTQSTDGREMTVKFVYNGDELLDCDVSVGREVTERFVEEVEFHIQELANSNTSASMPPQIQDSLLSDVQIKASKCENFLQARADQENMPQPRLPVPIDVDGRMVEQDEDDAAEPQEEGRRRQKRAYLIWPGTNWCGKGSKAEFAESYGEHAETDKCCQKHDQCPYIIEGFTTKFNLFNYRIHTLSICDCDEKFMNCLKSANTSTSVMVGKVFFNVVNTECFDLKLQKSCAKRSWWGGCEKYTTKWTASIRTLGPFPEKTEA